MTAARARDTLAGLGFLSVVAGVHLAFGLGWALIIGGSLAVAFAVLWALTNGVTP